MKIVATLVINTTIILMVTGCNELSLNSTGNPDQNTGANTEELEQQVVDLREKLQEAEAKAKRAPKVEVIEAKVEVKGVVTDAKGLIDKLADDSTTGEDVESQRRVIHYFESLYDAGNDAVPAIASFLDQDLEKEFGRQSMRQQLSITTAQIEEIGALGRSQWEELGPKMRELGEKLRGQDLSREERAEQFRALFEPMTEKFKEMLTPEQRAKLEEMGGSERDVMRSLMGGGRGGFGGGGDRGRGGGDRGGGRGPGGR